MMEFQGSTSDGDLNTGGICFSCEQIFSTQTFLEEHVCPFTSHICSCGTEFSLYEDMLSHNVTHEPGQQALHHEMINKRRFQKHIEEEEKLKRFKLGEVVWKGDGASASMKQASLASMKQALSASAFSSKISKPSSSVPTSYQNLSPSLNSRQGGMDVKSMFSTVGAPTVDLWTIYQPVVTLQNTRKSNPWLPYTCGKCGESFKTKHMLMSHANNSHIADKISGCIGCGLLLSSRKFVPRFHTCNSPSTTAKLKLITAKPPNYKSPALGINPTQNPRNYSKAGKKNSQMLQVTSALQLKNLNVRTFGKMAPKAQPAPSKQENSTVTIPQKSNWKHSPSPVQPSVEVSDVTCRVCHGSFESTMQLQRHKCPKADEFLAKHGRIGKVVKPKRAAPAPKASVAQVNGDRSRRFPANAKNQGAANKGQSVVNMDTGDDNEDDCYIVEAGPEKTSEMIYQVTSSVPIKT
ncbi:uncharacterized protein LOC130914481 [Corythoichthys intestinalis]|uniref:uncharacterized protein LOC130914481 n=1 Tax=Corythoichthys intestinalis TaxID=161448 RepID=UPI0025A6734A|nr:uncharacterized protein LOC130914481 [Corythoichthys intestinalis]